MSFTYDLASVTPSVVLISRVRLKVGDTRTGDGPRRDGTNVTDEEITLYLSDNADDVTAAAIQACEDLAADWLPVANTTIGDYSRQAGDRYQYWKDKAATLRETASSGQSGRINFDFLEPVGT